MKAIWFAVSVVLAPVVAFAAANAGAGSSAIAVFVPGNNSQVRGTVRFIQGTGGVNVELDLQGLPPGQHGFHVHEKGDLSAPDLMSAGGHFNPTGGQHAGPMTSMRHAGDLGNITAGADGKATVALFDIQIQLAGPNSIIGRSLIVHERADDFSSQPAGNAGSRIAGAVIGLINQVDAKERAEMAEERAKMAKQEMERKEQAEMAAERAYQAQRSAQLKEAAQAKAIAEGQGGQIRTAP